METFARLTEAPAASLMALHFLQLWSWPRQLGDGGAKPSSSFSYWFIVEYTVSGHYVWFGWEWLECYLFLFKYPQCLLFALSVFTKRPPMQILAHKREQSSDTTFRPSFFRSFAKSSQSSWHKDSCSSAALISLNVLKRKLVKTKPFI